MTQFTYTDTVTQKSFMRDYSIIQSSMHGTMGIVLRVIRIVWLIAAVLCAAVCIYFFTVPDFLFAFAFLLMAILSICNALFRVYFNAFFAFRAVKRMNSYNTYTQVVELGDKIYFRTPFQQHVYEYSQVACATPVKDAFVIRFENNTCIVLHNIDSIDVLSAFFKEKCNK